jgi:putative hydrolase of the HAD superfamily
MLVQSNTSHPAPLGEFPRAVLFDAVGTLIYPAPPVAEVYHAAGRRFGSRRTLHEVAARFGDAMARQQEADKLPPVGDAAFRETWLLRRQATSEARERRRWQKIVVEVFDDLRADDAGGPLLDELWRHFAQPASWALFDDVADVWRRLEQRGIRLGIASNFDQRLAAIHRGNPLLAQCPHLFWSAELGFAKPCPRFFRAVAARLELLPHEIMLVGDDEVNDYQGARAAGWQAILLQRDGASRWPHTIRALDELPAILRL